MIKKLQVNANIRKYKSTDLVSTDETENKSNTHFYLRCLRSFAFYFSFNYFLKQVFRSNNIRL